MKYKSFIFRDLENNIILARPDRDTRELRFDVLENVPDSAMELPLESVDVVDVDEPQEDICNLKTLFRYSVRDEKNQPVGLAELAEEDGETFLKLTDKLYQMLLEDIINAHSGQALAAG